ncbi:MAG: hypothetical protein ACP5OX_01315 [Minisyncoccia bacterium]
MKIFLKNIKFIIGFLLALSFVLVLLVFLKIGKNPAVLKRNELGLNFLTQQERIFNFYILGLIFLTSNYFLAKKTKIEGINLRKVLNYANIVIVVLLFFISFQIYLLNL